MVEKAEYDRWIEETVAMHKPWHMLVPQSIGGGFGWCLDCLRTVPVPALIDGDDRG